MSNMLSLLMAACLLVFPFATFAEDYGSQPQQSQQSPPVAQPLVREGDFAIKLAAQLNLGTSQDEATAEDMLARAGVAPANGWISDYPVTPEIIGQLSESIANASGSGKLAMSSDKAAEQLTSVAQSMELPLPATAGKEQSGNNAQHDPAIINGYYYNQGPPVITYYPPPVDYVYLYDWVPYPSFWFGFSFPGFYICHSFTTVVPVHHDHFHGHVHGAVVSNHVIDRHTGSAAFVDPVTRSGGSVRAETMLRSQSGRMFRNMSEFANSHGSSTASSPPGTSHAPRFTSPQGQRSAGAIQSRSLESMRAQRFSGTGGSVGNAAVGNAIRNFSRSGSVQPSPQPGTSGHVNNPPSSGVRAAPPRQSSSSPPPATAPAPSGTHFSAPHTPSAPAPSMGGMRSGGGGSWGGRAAGGGMSGGMRGR